MPQKEFIAFISSFIQKNAICNEGYHDQFSENRSDNRNEANDARILEWEVHRSVHGKLYVQFFFLPVQRNEKLVIERSFLLSVESIQPKQNELYLQVVGKEYYIGFGPAPNSDPVRVFTKSQR